MLAMSAMVTFKVSGSGNFTVDKHYKFIRSIGSGAYGIVISAKDTREGKRDVAIKKICNAFQDSIDAKRILREIKLLKSLKHDNVVSILDMIQGDNVDVIEDFTNVYIVTELMETDLHRIIYSECHFCEQHNTHSLSDVGAFSASSFFIAPLWSLLRGLTLVVLRPRDQASSR